MPTVTKKYYHNIDLDNNELLNAVIENRTTAPLSPVDGQIYYNTVDKKIYYYNSTTTEWGGIGSSAATIYTADGTLTANRVVDSGGFSLTLNPNLYLGGKVTGYTLRTYPVNFTTSTTSYNSAIQLDNTITANGGSQIFYAGQINSGTLTNDGTLGVLSSSLVGNLTSLVVRGLTSGARVSTTGSIVNINRGDSTDISTSANNLIQGYTTAIIHPSNLPTSSLTGYAVSYNGSLILQSGIVTTAVGADLSVNMTTSPIHSNSSVLNYYGVRLQATIGTSSGPTAILSNYYALYLGPITVGATGTISNRWGIYAPDVAMRHYFNGNVLLGSASDTALAKLQVTGAIQQSTVTSAILKTNSNGVLVAAVAGTDYVATETDPIYVASSWYTTTNNSTNWNTAFGFRIADVTVDC